MKGFKEGQVCSSQVSFNRDSHNTKSGFELPPKQQVHYNDDRKVAVKLKGYEVNPCLGEEMKYFNYLTTNEGGFTPGVFRSTELNFKSECVWVGVTMMLNSGPH